MDAGLDVSPYTVLQLSKDFTMEQLRANYKRLALELHPDRSRLDPRFAAVQFRVLTNSYKALAQEYRRRTGDSSHADLKRAYEQQSELRSAAVTVTASEGGSKASKKFNAEHFNEIFEKYKDRGPLDRGYEKWIQRNDPDRPLAPEDGRAGGTLAKYAEPEAAWVPKVGFTELGVDKVRDFSGQNDSLKRLNFMDYRVAHTTTRIVDPNTVKPAKAYRSVEELEHERGNISFTMTAQEAARVEARKRRDAEHEARRLANLRRQDEATSKKYEVLHRLLIQ